MLGNKLVLSHRLVIVLSIVSGYPVFLSILLLLLTTFLRAFRPLLGSFWLKKNVKVTNLSLNLHHFLRKLLLTQGMQK